MSKQYNAKDIVKNINSNQFTLEEIIGNSMMVQNEIIQKFGKMTNFFIDNKVIFKIISYALNYSETENWKILSHNSSVILSDIKNSQLLDKLTIEEELESEYEEEEEEESEDNNINDLSQDIIDYDELDTKGLDNKIGSISPNKKFSRQLTSSKSMTITSSKKISVNSFPYLDKIFEYLDKYRAKVEILINESNKIEKIELFKSDENNNQNIMVSKFDTFNGKTKESINYEPLSKYKIMQNAKEFHDYSEDIKNSSEINNQKNLDDKLINDVKQNELNKLNDSKEEDNIYENENIENKCDEIIDKISCENNKNAEFILSENDKDDENKIDEKLIENDKIKNNNEDIQLSNDSGKNSENLVKHLDELNEFENISKVKIEDDIIKFTDDNSLLSGYFERIFLNLAKNRKKRVRIF